MTKKHNIENSQNKINNHKQIDDNQKTNKIEKTN